MLKLLIKIHVTINNWFELTVKELEVLSVKSEKMFKI